MNPGRFNVLVELGTMATFFNLPYTWSIASQNGKQGSSSLLTSHFCPGDARGRTTERKTSDTGGDCAYRILLPRSIFSRLETSTFVFSRFFITIIFQPFLNFFRVGDPATSNCPHFLRRKKHQRLRRIAKPWNRKSMSFASS